MKYLRLLLIGMTYLCWASIEASESTPGTELRKERQEKRNSNGKVTVYHDYVYRGNQRVMSTTTFLVDTEFGLRKIQAYYSAGEEVVTELQYDDGTQMTRLFRGGLLSEMFKRHADGSVEPVSTEELETLKAKQKKLMEQIEK